MALPFDRCCACSLDGRRGPPQKLGANATNIKVAEGGFPVSSLLQMPVRFILLCVLDVEGESRNLHATTHQNVFLFISKARVQNHQRQYFTAVVVVVCVFFPSILDIKFVGRTSRGHTGGRSHRIFNPPSFCGACLDFCREKDSAIPFPRRP